MERGRGQRGIRVPIVENAPLTSILNEVIAIHYWFLFIMCPASGLLVATYELIEKTVC
jgi:hypothetical protein